MRIVHPSNNVWQITGSVRSHEIIVHPRSPTEGAAGDGIVESVQTTTELWKQQTCRVDRRTVPVGEVLPCGFDHALVATGGLMVDNAARGQRRRSPITNADKIMASLDAPLLMP
jgi:hypothetical protein